MHSSSPSNESATLRHISCMSCESHVTVSFGPFGFLSKCGDCGRLQHLDDVLEPIQSLSNLFAPVRRFVHRNDKRDEMRASA